MKKTIGVLFAVAAMSLSACGGGADRPTADEVSAVLTSDDNLLGTAIPQESADCVAKALVDSGLSDETLNALVEGDEDYEGSQEEEAELEGIGTDVAECVGAGAGS